MEPESGRVPVSIPCPSCGSDITEIANQFIREHSIPANTSPAAAPLRTGLRMGGGHAPAPDDGTAPVETAAPAGRHPATPKTLLEHTVYLVKERRNLLKFSDTDDVLDPNSGRNIGIAKEEVPVWVTLLRFLVDKRWLPTAVHIYEAEGAPPVASIRRGFTFLRSKVRVVSRGRSLGYFKSKILSLGGGFNVFDDRDQQVADVKGNWKGWDFRFIDSSGREIGTVTKKWAGLGKELFTSSDNYVISLTNARLANPDVSALLLAAGLAIDTVLKE